MNETKGQIPMEQSSIRLMIKYQIMINAKLWRENPDLMLKSPQGLISRLPADFYEKNPGYQGYANFQKHYNSLNARYDLKHHLN